jgi:hypothetical protein
MFAGHWATWQFCPGWKANRCNIGWAKLIAIELGIQVVVEFRFCNAHFLVHSDNMAVIGLVGLGKAWNTKQNRSLQHIIALMQANNLCITLEYVASAASIADTLSCSIPATDCKPLVLDVGGAPIFWLFPAMGTCSGHALRTYVCSWTFWTTQTCLKLSRFRLRCHWIGSACSGLRSHGYPIIAQTRSTELRQSSAALPYMLTIVSSCSADSGLTQPLAAAYASCMTHAVLSSMYLNTPALASCSSVQPLGHWDR